MISKYLKYRQKIPDGNTLRKEILEHLLNFSKSKKRRRKLVHKNRIGLLEVVD